MTRRVQDWIDFFNWCFALVARAFRWLRRQVQPQRRR